MVSETWVPDVGSEVELFDNSYPCCNVEVGSIGIVKEHYQSSTGPVVLVINFPVNPNGDVVKEFFAVSRMPYMYFQPLRLRGKPKRPSQRSKK